MKRLMAGAALLLASVLPASADLIVLTQSNLGPGLPGPYGTANVNLIDATHASFSVTSANGFAFGGAQAVNFNFSPGTFVMGPITLTPTFAGAVPLVTGVSAQNVSHLGNMNTSIDLFDGYTRSVTGLSFTLTNTTGTWADVASIFALNPNNFILGAHVFACGLVCGVPGSDAIATGFAGDTFVVPGPEVGTGAAGIFAACFGMWFMNRRRRNKEELA